MTTTTPRIDSIVGTIHEDEEFVRLLAAIRDRWESRKRESAVIRDAVTGVILEGLTEIARR